MTGMQPYPTPRALETDEIPGIVAQFRHGAELAKEAGFDGVEIHGANGYLIDQFLRDGTNQRTDRYGGSAANRARFLLEVTEAVVAVWGADRVGVRLSPLGAFNGMSDSDPATTFGTAVEALDGFGLAYLHLVEQFGAPLSEEQHAAIKAIRERWHGPYIANGAYDAAKRCRGGGLGLGHCRRLRRAVHRQPRPAVAPPDRRRARRSPTRTRYYGGDAKGYVDYPAVAEDRLAA